MNQHEILHSNFCFSVGLALTAMLSGVIVDKGGYQQLLMFFISFQLFALIAIVVLWKKHGPNCSVDGPIIYEENQEEEP